MINVTIILAIVIVSIVLLMRIFRKQIRRWVGVMCVRFKIGSIRTAIEEADKNRDETGRKTMIVYNTVSGGYEAVEKRLLKKAANIKNKNNAVKTDGRKKLARSKRRILDHDRVRSIEEKSLYVAR